MDRTVISEKFKRWLFPVLLFLCAVFYIFCKIDEAPPTGKMSGTKEPDIGMHEIAPGEVISQSFAWTEDTLAGISLMLAPEEGGIEDPIFVSLFRGDRLLKTWRVNKYRAGNTWTKFLLDKPQRNAQGTYTITVTADKQMELALGLTSEDAGAASGWMINGAENEGQYLCWQGIERDLSKSAVMIAGAAVLLCLCKIVYAPICLLLFLLPWESFGSRKRYAVHAVGLGAASIISSLGWFLIASSYLIEFQPGVKSGEQILHVLSHPLQYLETLFCTLNNNFSVYLMGAAGQNLGALDIPLGELLPLFCLTVLLMACGYESEKEVLERRSRCLMLAVFGIVVLLTFTSLYIQWTPYQSSTVRGVQGRYFLPAMLLLILGAGRLRRRMSIKNGCLAMAAANACAFSAMMVYMV